MAIGFSHRPAPPQNTSNNALYSRFSYIMEEKLDVYLRREMSQLNIFPNRPRDDPIEKV